MKRIGIILGMVLCVLQTARADTTKFYVDGTLYNTTTCTAGGNTTLPTNPTPPAGYVFTGWAHATYDFSTIDATNNYATGGTYHYAKSISNTCFTGTTGYQTASCGADHTDLRITTLTGQWKVLFPYGMVWGDSLCSITSGTLYVAGNPNEVTLGKYCWCRATAYKPSNSDIIYSTQSSPMWVIPYNTPNEADCKANCSEYCAMFGTSETVLRRVYFTGQ